jgi:membrane associated rhomboid family serine protease
LAKGLDAILESIIIPSRMVFLMWLFFFVEVTFNYDFAFLGIVPRTTFGAIGIFMAPLIHGSLSHIISNTIPLLMLGTALYLFYPRTAGKVFTTCYFLTGILVWLFARSSVHIGASGLVYGLAFYLIFNGFFKKDLKSVIISIVVLLTYDGIFIGLFPSAPGISWESHLFGGIVGFFSARWFR